MIDFLRGILVHREKDYVVLDVNGVGYRVFCTNPYDAAGQDEQLTTLYTHYHVREDAILLYGFFSRDEQSLFRRLIEVSGIGPKVAMGILSGGAPAAIVQAVQNEDLTFLTRLPGIGKKTAQRMILDLKDKLDAFIPISSQGHVEAAAGSGTESGTLGSQWNEVKQALMGLGYTDGEASRAIAMVKPHVSADLAIDELIKRSLKELYKG